MVLYTIDSSIYVYANFHHMRIWKYSQSAASVWYVFSHTSRLFYEKDKKWNVLCTQAYSLNTEWPRPRSG
jgi:hypothetical protein